MQKSGTYRGRTAKQFAGFLLSILFLAIPLIQTLHPHHVHDNLVSHKIEKSFSTVTEKCLICDYTAEIKGKQLLMDHPVAINVPNNVCATINTFVYTRLYKFTLQNFSNKGPPSSLN